MPLLPPRSIPSALYWALVGALVSFGFAAMLTIGPIFTLAAVVLAGVGVLVPAISLKAAPAALSGVAAAPFYIAWLNREGPGEICTSDQNGTGCIQEWSPWPFLIVGLIAIAVGVALFVQVNRSNQA